MILDLSHAITSKTPVYPGDPPVVIEAAGQLAKDGFVDFKVTLGTHVGTHIDVPAHMIEGGKKLADYDIDTFVVQAICIDATNGFNKDVIESADIKPGMAVLFYTGMDKYFLEDKYWQDFPVLDAECCHLLIDKGVAMVGADTGSADNADGNPNHKSLLGAGILIIENLANLKMLVGKKFELTALPLKLEYDGAPARVIARLS